MTLLVRNEQDVVAENILFHHRQGVDAFIVMDNLSSDATVEIVRDLSHSIPIELRHQRDDTYSQSVWVTEMARAAASEHGADWVINNDADEFWISATPGQRLRQVVETLPAQQPVQLVQRWNAALTRRQAGETRIDPTSIRWYDSDSRNSADKPLPPKLLHRACPGVQINQGNHSLSWPQAVSPPSKLRFCSPSWAQAPHAVSPPSKLPIL